MPMKFFGVSGVLQRAIKRNLPRAWPSVLLALVCTANAQPVETELLRGNAVTTDRVVDALLPSAVRARSLRLGRLPAGSTEASVKPSASLLITFETNSSALTVNAKRQLDVVATAMKTDKLASYRFTVEGHADPRGAPEVNLVLSQDRAQSVRSYLVDAHSIQADRLLAEGRGDREPMRPSQPTAAENRRVTFVTVVQ